MLGWLLSKGMADFPPTSLTKLSFCLVSDEQVVDETLNPNLLSFVSVEIVLKIGRIKFLPCIEIDLKLPE